MKTPDDDQSSFFDYPPDIVKRAYQSAYRDNGGTYARYIRGQHPHDRHYLGN